MPAFIADPAANLAKPINQGGNGCECGFQVVGNHEVGGQPYNPGYQLTATGDVGIGNPFLGGGGPRGIQLAVKFSF